MGDPPFYRTWQFQKESDGNQIIIKDDGEGFEPDAVKANRTKMGFGLMGMSERAKLLGGQTLIESARGVGTKVSIILPLSISKTLLKTH